MVPIAFILICIIETFTSFAIRAQVSFNIPDIVSVFYKNFFAGLIIMVLIILLRKKITVNKSELAHFSIIGICSVSIGPILLYYSANYIPGGLIAVFFSTIIITSEIIVSIINRERPNKIIIVSGLVGMIGVYAMTISHAILIKNIKFYINGCLVCFISSIFFAIGGVISNLNNKKNKTNILLLSFYSYLIGSFINIAVIKFFDYSLTGWGWSINRTYIISMIYLVICSSIISFCSNFYLCAKIGPSKASYAGPIFVIGATIASIFLDGLKWNLVTIEGLIMVVIASFFGLKAQKS